MPDFLSQPPPRLFARVCWLFYFQATIPFLIWLLVSAPLHAATLRVPQNFATIQQGINAAANGDTVLVAPGTYVENINFLGKAITVKSESGPEVTIIDGNRLGSVVTFMSGEAFSSVLQGFTIQNGLATQGGGITVQNSSPTITNNIITRNDGCDGLGIGTSFGSPIISGNQITNNHRRSCSGGFGGAGIIILGNSSAQILNNIISNNSISSGDGGGISLFSAGTPTIQGNIISGNSASGLSPCAQGGGIVIAQFGNALSANALIVQNLIVNNSAGCGGGIY